MNIELAQRCGNFQIRNAPLYRVRQATPAWCKATVRSSIEPQQFVYNKSEKIIFNSVKRPKMELSMGSGLVLENVHV